MISPKSKIEIAILRSLETTLGTDLQNLNSTADYIKQNPLECHIDAGMIITGNRGGIELARYRVQELIKSRQPVSMAPTG